MQRQPEFDWFGPGGKLEHAFWEFHHNNPVVYRLLVKYARQWKRYHAHCSINLLFERVRWEYFVKIESEDNFRLNNNHRAFYARLIEMREPDLSGFFRLRAQRIQSSFGPDNQDLPPGDHVA
jgi:hypothetical protein